MTAGHSDEAQARKPTPPAEDGGSHADSHEPRASLARQQEAVSDKTGGHVQATEPPLPDEEAPPLPEEPPPDADDDGWQPLWDYNANAYYFYNTKTGKSQWENPRVPGATAYSHGSYDRFANYQCLLLSFQA